jgi:hypothetical protein
MWIAHQVPVLHVPGVITGLVIACVVVLAACGDAWAEGRRLRRLIRKDVAAGT